MKVYRLLTRIGAVSAALITAVTATASASGLAVRMNAMKSGASELTDFGAVAPVTENGVTLVSARGLADASGMFISWDQPTQTATIALYSCPWGENAVERYAARVMDKVDTYGLELEPYNITAEFKLGDHNSVLKYNYKDTDGDIVSIGKTIATDAAATMVNDGTLMIPLESTIEMFGLDFEWDRSGDGAEVSIPDYEAVPTDISFMAQTNGMIQVKPVKSAAKATTVAVEKDAPVNIDPSKGTYLGRFKITHYCSCEKCCGPWGGNTAWAGKLNPGVSIAVDPTVIPKLSWVYIDGYGMRRAEDCGGAIKGNRIDMAVSSHEEAIRLGVVYADVYLQ